MAELTASNDQKKKGTISKSHNRRSTRVDLTPMVDLGFLLITFFVFTSAMTVPKAMDMTEIHDGKSRPVRNSASMTIIVGKDHRLYFYEGILQKISATEQVKQTDLHSVRMLIMEKVRETDPDYLMFIIKADKGSTFGDNIALLDEMNICGIKTGHYAETDICKEEAAVLQFKN